MLKGVTITINQVSVNDEMHDFTEQDIDELSVYDRNTLYIHKKF